MQNLFLIAITLISSNSFATYTDTIDSWTIKINGKSIINSNQTSIIYDHPMRLNLASYSDTDVMEICYWTDSGLEKQKWHFLFKDENNILLGAFTNSIDSTLSSKTFVRRKNSISFKIGCLKAILKEKNVNKIFVQFERDDINKGNPYSGKNICIISND